MIAGNVRPPIVPLKNEKIIRRHLHSVAFAGFLRWVKETRGLEYKNTGEFFAPPDPACNGVSLFSNIWIPVHPNYRRPCTALSRPKTPTYPNAWGWPNGAGWLT